MLSNRTIAPLLVVLGLLLGAAGCKPSDTILFVLVAGPKDLMPTQLDVTVSAGLDARHFLVPPMPSPGDLISLPASFTIALDRSHMGPIVVSIDALAADQSPLGYGTAMMQHIHIGGQTDISVMLMDGLPPDSSDAGADGPADANSTADVGDADGGVGDDGPDGSSSADGANDGSDALGLDGATD